MLPANRKSSVMITTMLALASFGLALSVNAAVNKGQADPASPMQYPIISAGDALPDESLKVRLLEWVGEHSDYDVSTMLASPPTARFCQHGSTLIYEGKAIHFEERLKGVYDEQTEQICLAQPWEASHTENVGVLLHELVHHVQFQSKDWWCPQRSEWEAYKLQESWLLEQGVKPEFDWMYILMSSSCAPRDIHS